MIEILTVIAIVAILASILVPVAGKAQKSARKKRAMVEMNSIKVAALQFQSDHRYMPWPGTVKVGNDMWTAGTSDQAEVMDLLTGNNALKKVYLQIPEKSRPSAASMVFNDPWEHPYRIGLDRNLDGAVVGDDLIQKLYGGEYIKEKVLVYSLGDSEDDEPLKTFDVPPATVP